MWRVIVAHLFDPTHKECNSQICHHKMALIYQEWLLEEISSLQRQEGWQTGF
jgi:hypothetical protein